MNTENSIYNGVYFSRPVDFEIQFRPTKWSTRAYFKFLKSLEWDLQGDFVALTIQILGENFKDKDTEMFLRAIIEKSKDRSKLPFAMYNIKGSGGKIKLKDENDAANALIRNLAEMKSSGLLACNWKELANLISDRFEVRYSWSTILTKLYDFKNDRS